MQCKNKANSPISITNCMSLDMFYTVLVVSKSPLIIHLNHDYISVMMRYNSVLYNLA